MFCSMCGKRVLDSMLFCPFCGAEIIIPDQNPETPPPTPVKPEKKVEQTLPEETAFDWDEPAGSAEAEPSLEPEPMQAPEPIESTEAEPAIEPTASPTSEPSTERVYFDEPDPDMATEFERSTATEYLFDSDDTCREPETVTEQDPPAFRSRYRPPEPPRKTAPTAAPDAWVDAVPKTDSDPSSTQSEWREYVSPRFRPADAPRTTRTQTEPEKPLDMYLDGDEDDFDAFEAAQDRRTSQEQRRRKSIAPRNRYEADDPMDDGDDDEKEGFLTRHIRGLVTAALLLVLLAAAGIYALSEPGQIALARINMTLPLKADVYGKLGYESYQAGEYAQAGVYYERALARDPSSYNYASSAAMAYISDKNTEKAAALLEKCVELKPNAVEPYIYLLNLYPNTATRPIQVTRLLEQGYLYTGDERLKQS